MSGLKERLARLKDAAAGQAEPASDAPAESAARRPEALDDNALHPAFREIGVEVCESGSGEFLLRRLSYPFPYRHGLYGLEELRERAPELGAVSARQNEAGGRVETDRLLFLDTETTGLGVGTGNVPFMVGIGYYTERAFIVEQTLIRHPGEERAMLAYLLAILKDKTHLVTYNGRTFDWPVLVNRYILNGWRKNGAEPAHIDFLHPSRALWKNTLESCRLGTVEEKRLGVSRVGDVSGALAPALYMRFLSDGDPSHLHGVYAHNEKDVLTLASLSVHFARLLEGHHPETDSAEELFRTASWLEKHGNAEQAERLFERLNGRADAGEGSWGLALASRYKRSGKLELALPLWRQAADKAEKATMPKLDAHVELAMHYEHRERQLLTALSYAQKALELALRGLSYGRSTPKRLDEREALTRRVERLKEKLRRQRNGGSPE